MGTPLTEVQQEILKECNRIQNLLLAKNRAYGNSAFEPLRIFSKAPPDEQLKVRIDDKLSRIARGKDTDQVPEQTVDDLIGYLILTLVEKKLSSKKNRKGEKK